MGYGYHKKKVKIIHKKIFIYFACLSVCLSKRMNRSGPKKLSLFHKFSNPNIFATWLCKHYRLFDPTVRIVSDIANIKELENLSLWQRLTFFVCVTYMTIEIEKFCLKKSIDIYRFWKCTRTNRIVREHYFNCLLQNTTNQKV